jgi:hypothetical protein
MVMPAQAQAELSPPDVMVNAPETAPTPVVRSEDLRQLGDKLNSTFKSYVSDRRIQELKWLRNLRQYLGIYDPDIDREMSANRSRAYPRITRIKTISVLSRIMALMFPGNERNWSLEASPSPDIDPQDVMAAIQQIMMQNQQTGVQMPITPELIKQAVDKLAQERADQMSVVIDDQLQELGGDQTYDYIALNRSALKSGILYGLGALIGPFARVEQSTSWEMDPYSGMPMPQTREIYKPQFEFVPVWDLYLDLSAKTIPQMDGYFRRYVMSRPQVKKLRERPGFFADQITEYLKRNANGNYKPQPFETEIRALGVKVNVNEMKSDGTKYEVIVWNGPVSGALLKQAGVEIEEGSEADDIDAEVWMIDGNVIRADMNPWRSLGVDVKTLHTFIFDEDDTAPIGNGLPNVIRDSQMSICAASRMLLDNASVVCGPNLELNTDLLRPDQDLASTSAYKIWYREGSGADASQPAVRNVQIDSHLPELLQIIELFMRFADAETFVGPATGGDMERGSMPSEPMRTAAGASMLRGDAALPFKDIIRNFDSFTQSIIQSLVHFNRLFNPDLAPAGDYNVIARGATSLIAKEVRGMQIDQLAMSLRPEEMTHVDERKFVEQRFAVRDLQNLLVSPDEASRRKAASDQAQQMQAEQNAKMVEANVRKLLSDAVKNIAQAQKNDANADATKTKAALDILEAGLEPAKQESGTAGAMQEAPRSDGFV